MMLGRVVVAGGGIGGIAAAAAVAPYADDIVVVERDGVDDMSGPRRGVPQSGQLHNLLARAQQHLEELLPGFLDALESAGASKANVSSDTHVFELGHRMPERDVGLSLMSASRPIIELAMRQRLAVTFSDVHFLYGSSVIGLVLDEHGRLTGVEITTDHTTTAVDADVVIDCSGANAAGLRWLTDRGIALPDLEELDVGQWYATCQFEKPLGFEDLNRFWMVFPTPPATLGALLSPSGERTWYASVSGRRGDRPPRTAAELVEHAQGLEDPVIGDILERATPIGEPSVFMKATATWRHYETWADPVVGLLPLGDAFASLNPLYGQGVSVAGWEAAELRRVVGEASDVGGSIDDVTQAYLRSAGSCIARAWELGQLVMADSTDVSLTAMKELAAGVLTDADLHQLYVRMWHLLEPSDRFDQPDVVARLKEAAGGVGDGRS